jgi:hypothetical protein
MIDDNNYFFSSILYYLLVLPFSRVSWHCCCIYAEQIPHKMMMPCVWCVCIILCKKVITIEGDVALNNVPSRQHPAAS